MSEAKRRKRGRASFSLAAAAVFGAMLATASQAAPAMWEVSDANSKIWLFGSIHGLPKNSDAWRTPLLDETIAEAARIWFETDVGPAGMAALTVKSMVAMFTATQQAPWTGRLTPEQSTQLATALKALNISLDQAAAMPPWLVAMQLSQVQMQQAPDANLDFTKGIDFVLEWELPAERKAFFETPGEQFDMLAGGSVDDQVAQVVTALGEADQTGPDMAELVHSWLAGDLVDLDKLIAEESAADPDFMKRLLTERNLAWLPKIEGMLADDAQNLVVVGTAHLTGTGSVVDLLQQAGYTVRRIQ